MNGGQVTIIYRPTYTSMVFIDYGGRVIHGYRTLKHWYDAADLPTKRIVVDDGNGNRVIPFTPEATAEAVDSHVRELAND